jgi:CubicO group peptidase (beta-lactamase class C family)
MELQARVTAAAKKVLATGKHVGIEIGVLQDGRKSTFGFGRQSAAMNTPPDGDSIFEIGSITKVFTAVLMVLLEREGLVSLDDPVRKHLPDDVKIASRNGKIIRLHHLATHTSGLPRLPSNMKPKDEENPYAEYTVRDLETFIAKAKLGRDPGEAYDYSNVGGGLLGHALSRRAGLSYEEVVFSRICVPLGMMDTRISLSGDQKARFLPGHSADGKTVPNWDLPALAGAGALRSSANDLLRFLEANLGKAPEPLASALQETHAPRVRAGGGMSVGLGWHISPLGTKDKATLHWHNGGTGGFFSYAGFVKERALAVVVLGNAASEVDSLAHTILISLASTR